MRIMHKFIQRKIYDTFLSKTGILTVFISVVLLCCSAFYFGEAIVEWSSEKYAVVFNSFSDNLLGKSYRTRLCLPVPIDVVYTWVNGTDPELLAALRKAKAELEDQTKTTNSSSKDRKNPTTCQYANCVKAPLAVFPNDLPAHFTLDYLESQSQFYRSIVKIESKSSDDLRSNFTLLHFITKQDVQKAMNVSFISQGITYQAKQAYFTSDITIPNSKLQPTVVLVSGFKKEYTVEEVSKVLPKHVMEHVFDIEMVGKVGVFRTSTSRSAQTLRGFGFNFTLDGRYLQFSQANLVYDLSYSDGRELDLTASRFEDNEELRYSLRSLEQYAPWVRQIFIVTNGQIPHWLNLDNSRVTVITHEDIFTNKSHLPTFSSPAIESHIHRIPGLSEKFIYLNDDVMFGAQVWPDDFFTHSKGQKVYLSWNIPDCAPGCPQSWIKDGYCDKACNVSECGYDAGDCAGGVPAFNAGNDWNSNWNNRYDSDMTMCAPGCSNAWIADKYCDQACNVKVCGFDAGDCGVTNFHNLYSIEMIRGIKSYAIPTGINEAYLNFSTLSSAKVSEASYQDRPDVRVAAVSNKYKVLTVVLVEDHNTTTFSVNVTFGDGITKEIYTFLITTNSGNTALSNVIIDHNENAGGESSKVAAAPVTEEPKFVFQDVPPQFLEPSAMKAKPVETEIDVDSVDFDNIDASAYPVDVRSEIEIIRAQHDSGEITLKGLKKKMALLLSGLKQDLNHGINPQKIKLAKLNQQQKGQNVLQNGGQMQPENVEPNINNHQPVVQQPLFQQNQPELPQHQGEHNVPAYDQQAPQQPVIQRAPEQRQIMQQITAQQELPVRQQQQNQPLQQQELVEQNQPMQQQAVNQQEQPEHQQPVQQQPEQQQQLGQQQHMQQQPVQQQPVQQQPMQQQPMQQQAEQQQQLGQQQQTIQQQPVQQQAGQQHTVQQQAEQQQTVQQQAVKQQEQSEQHQPDQQLGQQQQTIQQQPVQQQAGQQQTVQHKAEQQQIVQQQAVKQQEKPEQRQTEHQQQLGQQQPMQQQAERQHEQSMQQNQNVVQQDQLVQQQQQQPNQQQLDNNIVQQDKAQNILGNEGNNIQFANDNEQFAQNYSIRQNFGMNPDVPANQPQVPGDGAKLNHVRGDVKETETFKARQLKQYVDQEQEMGFLPWENTQDIRKLVKKRDTEWRKQTYSVKTSGTRRHLMDTFAQSLHHVNDLYNKMFGVKSRKVPGHIPHMIDRGVMRDLYSTFKTQWDITSSHRIRSGNDMQYAFSYYYFLMDSKRNNTAVDFIHEMDIDNSLVLSDRELRTMATRIFDSPLDLQSLQSMENHIINCSKHLPWSEQEIRPPPIQPERYYEAKMPQVTLPLLKNCGPLLDLIKKKVEPKPKYRYEIMGDEDINFKMIRTNLSTVVGQLDDMRRHPKKFMCLNDDIDLSNSEAMQIKALLADFYESMFPIRSQFELPQDYRNRFLHMTELREWKKTRDIMKTVIEILLVVLVLYSLYSYFEDQINSYREKKRRPTPSSSGESV